MILSFKRLVLTSRLNAFVKNKEATVLIEFAVGLPFFLLMAFGSIELIRYIMAHSTISQIALSVADNSSRSLQNVATEVDITESTVNDVFIGASLQQGELSLKNNGRIILSSVEEVKKDTGVTQEIRWQRCWGNLNKVPLYGKVNDVNVDGFGPDNAKIKASQGTAVMFVEVFYKYDPLFFGSFLSDQAKILHYSAAYMVRDPRNYDNLVTNPNNAPIASCPISNA